VYQKINGKSPSRKEQEECLAVVNHLRHLSHLGVLKGKSESRNPDVGKGLGFCLGVCALDLPTARALELDIKLANCRKLLD